MPQLINLSNLNNQNTESTLSTSNQYEYDEQDLIPLNPLTIPESLELMKEMFPNKMLFTIAEVATIVNVSYEFIREKASSGKIAYITMGTRKMIHIKTLNNIIIEGI